MPSSDLYSERTNLRTALGTIVIGLLGLLCLFAADNWQALTGHLSVQTIVREFGGLLVASVTLSILWELVAKRAFLAELMSKARLAEEIRSAGLITMPKNFYRDVDWPRFFRTVNKLDIFFAYGRTWRGAYSEDLCALAKRSGVRVRVVLPDPDNEALMNELARRFAMKSQEVRDLVLDSANDFIRIFSTTPQAVAQFSLWYLPNSPVFSFYRFDHIAILALYKHRQGRGEIPIFVVEQGGTLYDFIAQDFESFVSEPNGLARRVFP